MPLGHYLKAIGVLRLVAQQKDSECRGFWRDQHFCLLTSLDASALADFFLNEYAPTPFIAPWNKGSGFYIPNDPGLTPIINSIAPRLAPFREAIQQAREPLSNLAKADGDVRRLKDETKAKKGQRPKRSKDDADYKKELASAEREFKRLKGALFVPLALAWRGPLREWMDAAMVLSPEGEQPSWPALFGTGGNDGRLDFTNTAMKRLADLFDLTSPAAHPRLSTKSWLQAALFDGPAAQVLEAPVGQFLPGSSGGANGTTGPGGGSFSNPWDFVLMLEGAIAFRCQATRRLGSREGMRAAIPFAVASQAVGHATRGREKDARGEQWMPLWQHAATWQDVSALLGEGRAQLGRSPAKRPLDFARSIAKLGVARGLTGFVRYGYLERNGQSNLAVPLGHIEVASHPRARLLDDIASWMDRLRREADDAPARFTNVVSVLADAAFAVLTREAEPSRWQSLLAAIDQVERTQASGTAFRAGPCPMLSADWLDAAADDSPEWRLALALGSAARDYRRDHPFDTVRAHALPIDRKTRSFAVGADKRLLNDPRVVMTGRDPLRDLIALVERRFIEASQDGARTLPLVAQRRAAAKPTDLARFLAGEVDVERTLMLGRALMAVDWKRVRLPATLGASQGDWPDEAWVALRLCALPFPLGERTIRSEPAMFRRLAAGDAAGAVTVALRRLRAAGLRPPLIAATADPTMARRWAAAFAFPISRAVATAMSTSFDNLQRA